MTSKAQELDGVSKEIMFAEMISRRRAALRQDDRAPWFAIQTVPGAQLPRREFVVEETRSAKGYRIVPDIKHDLSAIERALEANGFEHYMPAEKRLVRDRRHTDLYKTRRFALMVGYVFVRNPHDWHTLLEKTPGVSGVVRSIEGLPLPIDIMDILTIRAMEAEYDAKFDIQNKNARAKVRKLAKNDPRLKKLVDKLDIAGKFTVPMTEIIAAE